MYSIARCSIPNKLSVVQMFFLFFRMADNLESQLSNDVEQLLECKETLETLPTELFQLVCSFLDAKFVSQILSQVCERFHEMINDDIFWKIRIGKRWPKKYPPIPGIVASMIDPLYLYTNCMISITNAI